MGSLLGGVKAGTLSGIAYMGGLALFNAAVLYALQGGAVRALSQPPVNAYCVATGVSNSTFTGTPQECFDTVVTLLIPIAAFLGFFVALAFASLLGTYYESLPTKNAVVKGEAAALGAGLVLLLFEGSGVYLTDSMGYLGDSFFVVWTVVFGFIMARLYRRYTRRVDFESQEPRMLRVMVDGRDLTGKWRTFATTSSHKIRAEVSNDASFTAWEAGGGVSIEDNRSFETVMEVNDDGSLKGIVAAKY